MDKNLIRNNNKLLRKQLDIKKASDAILSKIYSLKEFLAAKNVLIFYPLKYEINLLPLLDYKEKNFFLPKVGQILRRLYSIWSGRHRMECP